MYGLITRRRRARLSRAFVWPGILLCFSGLATVSLERVPCGSEHPADGRSVYHHHFFFAAHEHYDAADHPHRTPGPHRRKAPRKPATVAPASALFPPAGAGVLLAPQAVSLPVAPARALPGLAQPAVRRVRPRGPPASIDAPGTGREKGSPGCRT